MPSLNSIKQRIESVRKVTKVTGIVRLIATSRLGRSRSSAIQAGKFFTESQKVIALLLPHAHSRSNGERLGAAVLKKLKQPASEAIFIVAFGSNKGLCGNLNTSVARMVINHVERTTENAPTSNFVIHAVGKQIFLHLRPLQNKPNVVIVEASDLYDEKLPPEETFLNYKKLFNSFLTSSSSDIIFFYNKFISALTQSPSIFSLKEEFLHSRKKVNIQNAKTPLMDAKPTNVFSKAADVFLLATVNYLLRQQIASEYALKMSSMESATNNANKLQSALKLQYNKMRQSKITAELIDIIGGVEAITKQCNS